MAEATGGSVPAGAQRGKRARQQPARFGCADMKLSAAQVFGRDDEDEALTDHGSPPPAPPFARLPQSPPPPPPSFATAALAADTYQPARVAGSDGTLTIGSAEAVRAPKACTCVSPKARILRVQLRIKEPKREWVNINVSEMAF